MVSKSVDFGVQYRNSTGILTEKAGLVRNNIYRMYKMFLGPNFTLSIRGDRVILANDKQLDSFCLGSSNNVGMSKMIEKYLVI